MQNPWRTWTWIATDPWKVVVWRCVTHGNKKHEPTPPAPGPSPAAAKQSHLQQSKKSKVFRKEEHALDMAFSHVLLIFSKQECLRSCSKLKNYNCIYIYLCLLDTEELQPGKSQQQQYCWKAAWTFLFPGYLLPDIHLQLQNSVRISGTLQTKEKTCSVVVPLMSFVHILES